MADESNREYKLIEDKQKEMAPIFERMDKDEELYFLSPYKMLDNNGKEMPDIYNVTLNDPLMFATKSQAVIGGAKRQTVIEGNNLPEKQPATIEQFLDDILYLVNEYLGKRGFVSLDSYIIEQICLRGSIVGRSCVRWDNEKNMLVPDVLPIDSRFFVYENDAEKMIWGAPIYRRPKSQIEREYPGAKVGGKFGEVRDFWDGEKNSVFIDRVKVKEEENKWGYPPFVVSICPVGSGLNSEEALKHRGESIFWADRDLWPELNGIASILKTLGIEALFGGLQYESSQGEGATKPKESPFGPRKVVPVEKGGGYRPLPVNDIKNATRLGYSILESRVQRGSLTSLDYGNLTFPLSAVAYTEITAGRNDIFTPRIQAIAMFYQALSRMIINQCQYINKTLKLGQPGSQNTYQMSNLKGEYNIKYRFYTVSKQQTAADLAIANAARGFLPDDYIRRELMGVQDPDTLESQLLSQEAERTDEVLFLYRRACALLDEAETKTGKERKRKEFEASLLGQRIETILTQRQTMGSLSPLEGKREEAPQAKELLPLFAGRQGGGRPPATKEVESEEG